MVSASSFGYNYLDTGSTVQTGQNYSINVNNTEHLQGRDTNQLYSYFQSLFNNVYYSITNPFNYYNSTTLPIINLSGYVPYTNATYDINLNRKNLTNIGNVGIGTTNPATPLSVNGTIRSFATTNVSANINIVHSGDEGVFSTTTGAFSFQPASGIAYLYKTGTQGYFRTYASTGGQKYIYTTHDGTNGVLATGPTSGGAIIFQPQGTEKVRIDTTGKVGIGTPTPTESLEVNGSVSLYSSFPIVYFKDANKATKFKLYSSTGIGALYVENAVSGHNPFIIYSNDNIQFSGNVGIGTTIPLEKLHIIGNILLNDTYKMLFGTGKDASIYYDGTNMVINPKEVGTGKVNVLGSLNQTEGNSTINMIYGEIYGKNDTGFYTIDLVNPDTYYYVDNLTNGSINGFTWNAYNLTAQYSGLYKATAKFGMIVASGTGGDNGMKIFINGNGQNNCYDHEHTSSTQPIGFIADCLIRLNVGDNVSVRFDDHKSPVSDLIALNGNLNLLRIGNV